MSSSPAFVTGLSFRLNRLQSLWGLWKTARRIYPNLNTAWLAFRGVASEARVNARYRQVNKGVRFEGRVYTLVGMPGYPSKALDKLFRNELHRKVPVPGHPGSLSIVIFAFTKKCPLRCEHCIEWDSLNQHETLSKEDVLAIVQKFQDHGVAQIELSGGEPLNRYHDMLDVLRQSDTLNVDFWMLTSGYHLTAEKARELREAGLRGVSVSLDHWNAEAHDKFRGVEGAYHWALQATQNALEAGLLVSLSMVPVHDFCTPHNLWTYAELAKKLNVHFIRILEPRAGGHYAGLPVELTEPELNVLDRFVHDMSRRPDYPPVEYHTAFQRKAGCFGSGKRYLYVDTDGDAHTCPFCRHKCGNVLQKPIGEIIKGMGSCPAFQVASPKLAFGLISQS